jgi:hypothetical protein
MTKTKLKLNKKKGRNCKYQKKSQLKPIKLQQEQNDKKKNFFLAIGCETHSGQFLGSQGSNNNQQQQEDYVTIFFVLLLVNNYFVLMCT